MKDLNKIIPDMQKAYKESREEYALEVIKTEFPDAKGYKVSYDTINNRYTIFGLTDEQNQILSKLLS